MGWKNVKEHYRIGHIVHVTDEGICIGSPYISDLIVIGLDGKLIKKRSLISDSDSDNLGRYLREMNSDLLMLESLVKSKDKFDKSITVYTYDGGEIIEKQCEILGWPNVTHDGELMYENRFSTDRSVVVEIAKRSAAARIEMIGDSIQQREIELAERIKLLDESKANLANWKLNMVNELKKFKTAEQHFLANIVVRIVELHNEKKRNNNWIRLPRSAESKKVLEIKNELIAKRIQFLSNTFRDQCDLPLDKARF